MVIRDTQFVQKPGGKCMDVSDGKKQVVHIEIGVEPDLRETRHELIGTTIIVKTEMQLVIGSGTPVTASQITMAGREGRETTTDGADRDGSTEDCRPVR